MYSGMDILLAGRWRELQGQRVGLVCHPASRDCWGVHTAVLLRERLEAQLTCLMGPEHGFYGSGAAGERIKDGQHPDWRIPIYSLYGETAPVWPEMARQVDVVIYDLQDLSVRCYTYVHTLRQLLEAATEFGFAVWVTDRATPLMRCVDGPLLNPAFRNTVAPIPAPLIYGMTPGETASWLRTQLSLTNSLEVVWAEDLSRSDAPTTLWPTWVPPSPAIRSPACAWCFPVTVFTEALPQLDCARATPMAFQVLSADWLDADTLLAKLATADLPGIRFAHYHDIEHPDRPGIQIDVTDVAHYQPAHTAVHILEALQQCHGINTIWDHKLCRPDWFDKLMGTDRVRRALQSGQPATEITAEWDFDLAAYHQSRQPHLCYQ
jgi:uncharacterized protein YbbC (DUF1343 family)